MSPDPPPSRRRALSLGLGAIAAGTAVAQTVVPNILDYIKQTWATLTRTPGSLAVAAADPKFAPDADGRWPIYIPRDEDRGALNQQLQAAMAQTDFDKIDLRMLPPDPDGAR